MLKTTLYNVKGEKKGDVTLADPVFGVPSNDVLVHQVYVAIAANGRIAKAHTKGRGERSGSGKKPWKQKGTGRARIGSIRAPHWRKGGVVFGPTKDQNFSKETNKKMRRKAVVVALSDKLRAEKIRVIDAFSFEEKKTKNFSVLLNGIATQGRSSLVAFAPEERETMRLSRNIDRVENILIENLNVYDLLNTEFLILSEQSTKFLEAKFAVERSENESQK